MIFPYFSQEIFPADFPMIFPTMNLHSQKIFARSTPSSWPTAPFWVGRQWRASGLVRKFEEIAKESWRMMKTLYVTCLFNMFVICLHHFLVWYVCTIFRLIYIFFAEFDWPRRSVPNSAWEIRCSWYIFIVAAKIQHDTRQISQTRNILKKGTSSSLMVVPSNGGNISASHKGRGTRYDMVTWFHLCSCGRWCQKA